MYNKTTIIGNLGKDPVMKFTPNGIAVTNFSVATTARVSKDKTPNCPDGWKESYNGKAWELTTWWNVTAWRGLAETCNQFLAKGRTVYVEGEVKGEAINGAQNPRVWTGNDGVPRASFELTARVVKFLGGRSEGNGHGSYDAAEAPPGYANEEEPSIPF